MKVKLAVSQMQICQMEFTKFDKLVLDRNNHVARIMYLIIEKVLGACAVFSPHSIVLLTVNMIMMKCFKTS